MIKTMEEMRQTLSFSIIKILGTETASGGKNPRLPGSDTTKSREIVLSPSNSSTYELEVQTHNRLETVLKTAKDDDTSDQETEMYEVESSHTKRPGRMRFTPVQIQALEKRFQKQHYLLPTDRKFLAKSLHMTERQVKTWFQNKRAQYKRTRPLVRNPVYHHPSPPATLTLSVPHHLHLLQTRPFGINIHLPGLGHPSLHPITSPPPPTLSALPSHLPMPMAYVPVPVTPPN